MMPTTIMSTTMHTPFTLDAQTLLPELFKAHPQTRAVFNRYGLRGCGGPQGPSETLAFFAGAHGIDLPTLLTQVRQAIHDPLAQQQAQAQLQSDAQPRISDAIYRPFFLTGLLVILTVGAAWGTLILWKIAVEGSFTGISIHEVNAHGHAQIMGWVGLFIMGFAYQAFPRMWHVELPMPRVALMTWLLMLIGISARCAAMMFTHASWAVPWHTLGTVLEVLAVLAFACIMLTALRRSRQPMQPYIGFALASCAFLLVQSIYSGWHVHALITAADRAALLAQIATFQSPLRDLQIHGLAMLMIFAVGMRMFPVMFGLPEMTHRRAWWALGILLTAIMLEVSLFLAYRLTEAHAYAAGLLLPWSMLLLGAGLIVIPWKLWQPLPEPGRSDRSAKFIRIAFAWLFVALVMLLLLPVYQMISGIVFSHAYYGAVRHAITVGFISMMIVGMGAKVVPTLRGIEASGLPRLWLPFVLLNLGCAMRVVFQIGTDWHPAFFKLVGFSGLLEWTALLLWSLHLAAIMLNRGRYRQSDEVNWGPRPTTINAEHRVAAVLHWYPELEPVFVTYGFDLIRVPFLRRTLARQVTLQQVCRMKNVPLESFLNVLNASRTGLPLTILHGR